MFLHTCLCVCVVIVCQLRFESQLLGRLMAFMAKVAAEPAASTCRLAAIRRLGLVADRIESDRAAVKRTRRAGRSRTWPARAEIISAKWSRFGARGAVISASETARWSGARGQRTEDRGEGTGDGVESSGR